MYNKQFNTNKNKLNNKLTGRQALEKVEDYIYQEIDNCKENFIRESALREILDIIRVNKGRLA